jgi:hypothetical protein
MWSAGGLLADARLARVYDVVKRNLYDVVYSLDPPVLTAGATTPPTDANDLRADPSGI